MINFKVALVLFVIALGGCACNGVEGSPEAPPTTAVQGFHFDHTLGRPSGCANARSTDLTKVILRGDTCLDDGSQCFDVGAHQVDVWVTDETLNDAPYAAATFVDVVPCS